MLNIRKFLEGIGLTPKTTSTIDTQGELEVLSTTGKLNYHNGVSVSPVVTEAHTATLTNKTIDGNNNTVINVGDGSIAPGVDATKIADGSVDNTEFQYLDGVTAPIQTQLDALDTRLDTAESDIVDLQLADDQIEQTLFLS